MSNKSLKYYQFMNNISGDLLFSGLVGYGLFPDKLPPFLTSVPFLNFYEQNQTVTFSQDPMQYIFYESMRNTNVPRMMGIPNPIAYALLCQCIKSYWSNIQTYFKEQTKDQSYKVSRIHIRRKKDDKSLFLMSYHNFISDGDPETDLLFDAYYIVKADLSQCFPSMYSHAIAWALVGKEKAKANRDTTCWYNQLDLLTRNIKDGETNGFLIGPHTSNLLSEIILCAIDCKLTKWHYFRNIDDYTCFVKNQQEAEAFLVDLNMALKEFGLALNHKKTEIIKLPVGQEESWIRKIKNNFALYPNGQISYPQIHGFMEFVVDLVKETNNSAIINFAMKMIAKRNLNEKARQYYIKIITHLSLVYTYLFPFLDEFLFIPFDVSCSAIQSLAELMYKNGNTTKNAESISYSIYFAIKYRFKIFSFNSNEILANSDCILCTVAWQYAKINDLDTSPFYEYAKELSLLDYNFNRNWLFVYEVLQQNDLKDTWSAMKKRGVSFLIPLKDIFAKVSPDYELMDIISDISCDCDSCNEFLTELWRDYIAFPHSYNSTIHEQYFKTIILNLRIAFVIRRNVRIPKSQKYYDDKFGKDGELVSNIIKHIVSWLKENCYIGERVGDPLYGYSSYWAKQKLYSRFSEIPTGMLKRPQKYSSCVVIKDNSKQVVDIPLSSKALSYQDALNKINKFYASHKFSYYPTSQYEEILFPYLVAVFNDSSWDLGGRLYSSYHRGVSYQSVPSDLRTTFLINGKKTIEIDYSGLHISMLYAQKGIQPPQGTIFFFILRKSPVSKISYTHDDQCKQRRTGSFQP